jgi:aspartate racemase
VIIDSVDLKKVVDLIGANRLEAVADYLSAEIDRLGRAGADFGAIAANTPHLVFDTLRRRSPIPLVSIVESTREAARTLGLRRVGIFGTRFTMRGRFYSEPLLEAGIALVVPAPAEQETVHDRYMTELVNGVVLPETRRVLLAIVERMRTEEGIEGLILGGTELTLILGDAKEAGIPLLDTAEIHVEEVVARLLS